MAKYHVTFVKNIFKTQIVARNEMIEEMTSVIYPNCKKTTDEKKLQKPVASEMVKFRLKTHRKQLEIEELDRRVSLTLGAGATDQVGDQHDDDQRSQTCAHHDRNDIRSPHVMLAQLGRG